MVDAVKTSSGEVFSVVSCDRYLVDFVLIVDGETTKLHFWNYLPLRKADEISIYTYFFNTYSN